MTQISDKTEGLKEKANNTGTLPLPFPLLTLGDSWKIITFFDSYAKTKRNRCCNHISGFVLIPTTIPPPTLRTSVLYTLPYTYPLSCSLWVTIGSVIANVCRFLYKPSGHNFENSLSENRWLLKGIILLNKIKKYVHLLFIV